MFLPKRNVCHNLRSCEKWQIIIYWLICHSLRLCAIVIDRDRRLPPEHLVYFANIISVQSFLLFFFLCFRVFGRILLFRTWNLQCEKSLRMEKGNDFSSHRLICTIFHAQKMIFARNLQMEFKRKRINWWEIPKWA